MSGNIFIFVLSKLINRIFSAVLSGIINSVHIELFTNNSIKFLGKSLIIWS